MQCIQGQQKAPPAQVTKLGFLGDSGSARGPVLGSDLVSGKTSVTRSSTPQLPRGRDQLPQTVTTSS